MLISDHLHVSELFFDNISTSPILRYMEVPSFWNNLCLIDIEKDLFQDYRIIYQEQKGFLYKKKIIRFIREDLVLLLKELFNTAINAGFQRGDDNAVLDGTSYHFYTDNNDKVGFLDSPDFESKMGRLVNIMKCVIENLFDEKNLNEKSLRDDVYCEFDNILNERILGLIENLKNKKCYY